MKVASNKRGDDVVAKLGEWWRTDERAPKKSSTNGAASTSNDGGARTRLAPTEPPPPAQVAWIEAALNRTFRIFATECDKRFIDGHHLG